MRVLAVTTWYPSPQDPVAGIFVKRHLEAIAARHELYLAHLVHGVAGSPVARGEQAQRDPRIQVLSLAPGSLFASARALRSYAAEVQPDVVHTMVFSSLPAGALVRLGRAWVHTEHWSGISDPSSVSPGWARAARARHLLRAPDIVTTVSSYLQEAVQPFTRKGSAVVVPNVVVGPPQALARSPQPAGRMNLLAVGSLNPIKNPILAVGTLAELRRRGFDVHLRWVGSGALDSAMRECAQRLGVSDRLELTGQLPPDALTTHHRWSTCFFLPTQHETFCLGGAEALLHGRPVVLGARGGQRDFVTRDVGSLVTEQSAAAYADAVVDVHRRLGGLAPERFATPIRARFSPEVVAQEFDRVYEMARRR
ncbi:MAG: glycosyltransferase [Dermatophilaceae bacterium]